MVILEILFLPLLIIGMGVTFYSLIWFSIWLGNKLGDI